MGKKITKLNNLLVSSIYGNATNYNYIHTINIIIIVGLLIRLLLMPFALHADFISYNWRAHLISTHFIFPIPVLEPLGHILYALNQLLFSPIFKNYELIFLHPFGVKGSFFTSSVNDWLTFVQLININKILFFLKIPHLFFDFLTLFLLMLFFKKPKEKILAASIWLFNPVNLYTFYIFSRHDSISIFFIILSLFFLKKEKLGLSGLSLWLGILTRLQSILFVPFYLIFFIFKSKKIKNIMTLISIFVLVVFITFGISKMINFNTNLLTQIKDESNSIELVSISNVPHVNQLFRTTIGGIPLFVSASVFLLLWFVSIIKNSKFDEIILTNVLLMFMLLYFSINPFSFHYFVWLSPFLTLFIARNSQYLYYWFLIPFFWIITGLFGTDLGVFSQNLFLPLSYSLYSLPLLPEFIDNSGILGIYNSSTIVLIARGALTGVLTFFLYLVTITSWKEKK